MSQIGEGSTYGQGQGQGQEPVIQPPPLDEEMNSGAEEEVGPEELKQRRRQLIRQAHQVTGLIDQVTQLSNQIAGIDRTKRAEKTKKPRIPTPKKYREEKDKLKPFLTSIKIYYAYLLRTGLCHAHAGQVELIYTATYRVS